MKHKTTEDLNALRDQLSSDLNDCRAKLAELKGDLAAAAGTKRKAPAADYNRYLESRAGVVGEMTDIEDALRAVKTELKARGGSTQEELIDVLKQLLEEVQGLRRDLSVAIEARLGL